MYVWSYSFTQFAAEDEDFAQSIATFDATFLSGSTNGSTETYSALFFGDSLVEGPETFEVSVFHIEHDVPISASSFTMATVTIVDQDCK